MFFYFEIFYFYHPFQTLYVKEAGRTKGKKKQKKKKRKKHNN